jgi:hypothetical protein
MLDSAAAIGADDGQRAALTHPTLARRQRKVVAFHPRSSRLKTPLQEPFVVTPPHRIETRYETHATEITASSVKRAQATAGRGRRTALSVRFRPFDFAW